MKNRPILRSPLFAALQLVAVTCSAQTLSWADRLVSTGTARVTAVCTDDLGNSYAAGNFNGVVDMDPGPQVLSLTATSTLNDGFIAKYDTNGQPIWALPFSTDGLVLINDMAARPGGGVALCGQCVGNTDFDPGAGNSFYQAAGIDAFACALTANGDLAWLDTWPNTNANMANGVAVDGNGNVALAASLGGNGLIDIDPGVPTAMDSTGVYVIGLAPGGALQWYDRYTAEFGLQVNDVAFNGAGDLFAVGLSNSTLSSNDLVLPAPVGNSSDAFIIKYAPGGSGAWGHLIGGTGVEAFNTVAANANGKVWVAGEISGTTVDLNPLPGVNMVTAANTQPVLLCLDANSNYIFSGALAISTSFGDMARPYSVVADDNDACWITGEMIGVLATDLFGGPGQVSYFFSSSDAFLCNYGPSGALLYSGAVTGDANNVGKSVAIDAQGALIYGGLISGNSDIDPGPVQQMATCPTQEGVLLKLGPASVDIPASPQSNLAKVFPNPANDMVNVTADPGALITLSSIDGAKVREVRAGQQGLLSLEIGALAPGSYVIDVRNNGTHRRTVLLHE